MKEKSMKKNLLCIEHLSRNCLRGVVILAICSMSLLTSCSSHDDPVEMGAITQQYNNADATVGCILAGVDIVLGPQNFPEAFDAVDNAVEKGIISEERINQSVRRILRLKIKQ